MAVVWMQVQPAAAAAAAAVASAAAAAAAALVPAAAVSVQHVCGAGRRCGGPGGWQRPGAGGGMEGGGVGVHGKRNTCVRGHKEECVRVCALVYLLAKHRCVKEHDKRDVCGNRCHHSTRHRVCGIGTCCHHLLPQPSPPMHHTHLAGADVGAQMLHHCTPGLISTATTRTSTHTAAGTAWRRHLLLLLLLLLLRMRRLPTSATAGAATAATAAQQQLQQRLRRQVAAHHTCTARARGGADGGGCWVQSRAQQGRCRLQNQPRLCVLRSTRKTKHKDSVCDEAARLCVCPTVHNQRERAGEARVSGHGSGHQAQPNATGHHDLLR